MKVVILAGGLGTRLGEEAAGRPKPMVELAGEPILMHLLRLFADQGHTEFVIALGYRGDVIKRFLWEYHYLSGDVTLHLGKGVLQRRSAGVEDWTVHLVETGPDTATGGRLRRLAPWIGTETFLLTYGDGLADVDLADLVAFHQQQGRLATVTAVRPPAHFGVLDLDGPEVTAFAEKPRSSEGWVNGGFFVLEPECLDRIDGDDTFWEHAPLEGLAAEGQLSAFRHEGFWQCMDTPRDVRRLDALARSSPPPWRTVGSTR